MVIDGPTDAEVFTAYVCHVLAPSLHVGDIVILDNLSPHKMVAVEAAIRAVGAEVLFLPPYSPDLNPIEQMRSKVKAFLCALKARTRAGLFAGIRDALRSVTPEDVLGWFSHCGYVATQS